MEEVVLLPWSFDTTGSKVHHGNRDTRVTCSLDQHHNDWSGKERSYCQLQEIYSLVLVQVAYLSALWYHILHAIDMGACLSRRSQQL